MRRASPPLFPATLIVAGLVVVTACAGADESVSDASDPAPATTHAAPATTAAATEATSSTGAAPAETGTSVAVTVDTSVAATTSPAASADCLVGRWVVAEDELNAFYDAVASGIDETVGLTISGEAGLEFTETAYAWSPAFTLALDLNGVVGSGEAGGSITGTYTATDGVLTTEVGESAMTLTIELGGQTIDGAALGNSFISGVPFASSPYTCDGPTPVIMFETVDDRHAVTLTPAD